MFFLAEVRAHPGWLALSIIDTTPLATTGMAGRTSSHRRTVS
jgi:hypothetical protein